MSLCRESAAALDVLIVDDDEDIRSTLAGLMRDAGYHVVVGADSDEAMAAIEEQVFDIALLDVHLPKSDGVAVFRRIQELSPETEVILMTAYATVPDAVASLRLGVCDYLPKPFEFEALQAELERVRERRATREELRAAREELAARASESSLVGRSPAMVQLDARLDVIAQSDAPVVITGESGTGKELAARSIHMRSKRRDGPFVAANCAGFPETLLEAELFGHERGAFTGAVKRREGRFQAAEGGTLLLDEIGEMSLSAQCRLLRVLQEGVVEPLGSDRPVPIDVRVLAATHRNLRELVAAGRFREDLFYRLNVLEIHMPSLRDRKGDLALLLAHFLERLAPSGAAHPGVSPRAWAALAEYSYPGNVRELAHAIERSLVLSEGREIDLEHLPPEISGAETPSEASLACRPLAVAVEEFEREYIVRALRSASTRTRAAEMLGISRKNLWQKLRKYEIASGVAGVRR